MGAIFDEHGKMFVLNEIENEIEKNYSGKWMKICIFTRETRTHKINIIQVTYGNEMPFSWENVNYWCITKHSGSVYVFIKDSRCNISDIPKHGSSSAFGL